jgi:hypothetical protein
MAAGGDSVRPRSLGKHAKEKTMAFIEREIHTVRIGKWDEAIVLAKRWQEWHRRRGRKVSERWCRSVYGANNLWVFVAETEWESLAALEAYALQEVDDPELKALQEELWAQLGEVYESIRREIYYVIPQEDTKDQ